jgi:hypothetical protein
VDWLKYNFQVDETGTVLVDSKVWGPVWEEGVTAGLSEEDHRLASLWVGIYDRLRPFFRCDAVRKKGKTKGEVGIGIDFALGVEFVSREGKPYPRVSPAHEFVALDVNRLRSILVEHGYEAFYERTYVLCGIWVPVQSVQEAVEVQDLIEREAKRLRLWNRAIPQVEP